MATATKKKRVPLTNRKPPTKKGDNEISSSKMFHIPPHLIDVEPDFNQRIDYGSDDFEILKESIKENGVEEPLRVIPNPNSKSRFFLREGHRRMKAVELLLKAGEQIKKVPAILATKETPEQSLFRMINSNSGKSFSTIELGLSFTKLIGHGWEVKEIAKKTGHPENRVYFCLSLVKTPKKYHLMLAKGVLQDSMVARLFSIHKDAPEKAEAEIEQAIKKGTKEHEIRVKTAVKVAKTKGVKLNKKDIKPVKVTAKHLSPKSAVSTSSTPLQKIGDAIAQTDKKPELYDQNKVQLLSIIFQCVTNKGTVNEILEVLKKGKK